MNFRSILFFLTLICNFTYGQDSTAISIRIREHLEPANNFVEEVYSNPANQNYKHKYSLSDFGISYNNLSKEKNIQQLGNRINQFLILAESYYKVNTNNVVWGKAYYKKGQRKKVKWNESSDYHITYPYVMADSIGGNLSFEEYNFQGGYSKKYKKMSFGGTMEYRALMEYRASDPRPKNTVSDLKGSIGISRETGDNYIVATAIELQKYTQSNNIKFFSELGAPAVYHMTGLGTYNNLLTGNKLSSYYDGGSYGANIQWFSKNREGFAIFSGYNRFHFDKIMTDFQNLIPSSLVEQKYATEISYLKKINSHNLGMKMNISIKNREGTESKFYNQSSSSYIKIYEEVKYKNEVKNFDLSGLYSTTHSTLLWSISPGISLKNISEKYLDPKQELNSNQGIAKLNFSVSKFLSNSIIHLSSSIEHTLFADSEMKLNDSVKSHSILEMLNNNLDYISSSYTKFELSSGWYYRYSPELTVVIKAAIDYLSYSRNENNLFFQANIGLIF